jgi:hypothetical protein
MNRTLNGASQETHHGSNTAWYIITISQTARNPMFHHLTRKPSGETHPESKGFYCCKNLNDLTFLHLIWIVSSTSAKYPDFSFPFARAFFANGPGL